MPPIKFKVCIKNIINALTSVIPLFSSSETVWTCWGKSTIPRYSKSLAMKNCPGGNARSLFGLDGTFPIAVKYTCGAWLCNLPMRPIIDLLSISYTNLSNKNVEFREYPCIQLMWVSNKKEMIFFAIFQKRF